MQPAPDGFRDLAAWPYAIEVLDVEVLFIDTRYQRSETTLATEIANDYDRLMLDPLWVSRRPKGKYAIVDGQNRWIATKRIGQHYLICMVLSLGKDPAQREAMLFARRQEMRKNITPVQKFKAHRFGGDEVAVNVGRILDKYGIEVVELSGFAAPPSALGAIDRVQKIYRASDEAMLRQILETIISAWPDERGRFQSEVLGGLYDFFRANEDADLTRLITALSEPALGIGTVHNLKERSSALRKGTGLGGGSTGYTRTVIEGAYRKAGRGRWKQAHA